MTALKPGKEYEWHGSTTIVPMGRLVEVQGPMLLWDNGTRTTMDHRFVEVRKPGFLERMVGK